MEIFDKKSFKSNFNITEKYSHCYDALIVGSGAAGLNAAISLYDQGIKNIALITEGLYMGTSINTGSDKQTYYKISTCGSEKDSVRDMAKTLYNCGCMEGFHALIESALSLRSFFKLCEYNVPFPMNEYGEYVGYQTDHDKKKRATSCGPLTSKLMCEKMIDKIKNTKIEVFENRRAIKIITDEKSVFGIKTINFINSEFEFFKSANVILALGGAAGIYDTSVYPKAQIGGLGIAISAGVKLCNLTEWQYGIASIDFRWNLSGSYQQVIPRYVSMDDDGNLSEFLSDYINEDIFSLIFQKGYNWPFSPENLNEEKSSMIDIALYYEKNIKNRKIFIDYRQNPKGYKFENLSSEVQEYLKNSKVENLNSPIERLIKLNPQAYDLFYDNGIDLKKELLEIDICAQHCNGGIKCDKDYMTNIKGLYAVGECAAVFGITRPGGAALNSTQVSSLRSALAIKRKNDFEVDNFKFEKFKNDKYIKSYSSCKIERSDFSKIMSQNASFIRSQNDLYETYLKLSNLFSETVLTYNNPKKYFENKDLLLTALAVVYSQIVYIENGGVSRGGFLVKNSDVNILDFVKNGVELNENKREVIDIFYKKESFSFKKRNVSAIPKSEQWFETVAFETK